MPYTGVQRIILKGLLFGSVQTRNMFVGQTQLGIGDTDGSLCFGYLNRLLTPILPYITTSWTGYAMLIQHRVDGEWIDMEESAQTWTGTGTGDVLPNLVSAVLVAKAVGKRLIGRKFFSGIVESATTANALTGGALAAFAQAAINYFTEFTSVNGGIFGPGIVAKDNSFHAFGSGILSALLGTMRRRKPGLGI